MASFADVSKLQTESAHASGEGDDSLWDVALLLAPGHGPLLGNDALGLLHVDLVADDDKGEVVRVPGRSLDQKLIAPGIQPSGRDHVSWRSTAAGGASRLEGLGRVDVVDEDAAVCAAVEGDAEGLEALLAGRVPELHRDEPIVDHDLLGQAGGVRSKVRGGLSDGLTSLLLWWPCTGWRILARWSGDEWLLRLEVPLVDELAHEGGFALQSTSPVRIATTTEWASGLTTPESPSICLPISTRPV
jgi:hypothetical protein